MFVLLKTKEISSKINKKINKKRRTCCLCFSLSFSLLRFSFFLFVLLFIFFQWRKKKTVPILWKDFERISACSDVNFLQPSRYKKVIGHLVQMYSIPFSSWREWERSRFWSWVQFLRYLNVLRFVSETFRRVRLVRCKKHLNCLESEVP